MSVDRGWKTVYIFYIVNSIVICIEGRGKGEGFCLSNFLILQEKKYI